MKHQIIGPSGFGIYSIIRYSSMIVSFAITLIMFRVFSFDEFVLFQTLLSCFVLLYWIIDLGSIDLIVLSKNDNSLVRKYSSGRIFRFVSFTTISSLIIYLTLGGIPSLVMIAISLDYYNDSMIIFRTLRHSLSFLSLTLIIRKTPLLTFLIYLDFFNVTNKFEAFTSLMILTNLPWVLMDILRLPFSIKEIFYWDNKSKLNTLQQGGNFLANLDLPLLNLVSFSSIIPIFVLGKRLLQVGSIFGQFKIPFLLAADIGKMNLDNLRREILKNFKLTLMLNLLICILFEIVEGITKYLGLTMSDRILLYGCLFISSISVVTTQQSAILKALHEFKCLTHSTFCSTLSYLIAIFLFLEIFGDSWLFLIALFINFIIELGVQELGFKGKYK